MLNPYVYAIDGYTYKLLPVFSITVKGFCRVRGAELYGAKNNKYYGYWERHNMPLSVIRDLEKYCKAALASGAIQDDGNGHLRTNRTY